MKTLILTPNRTEMCGIIEIAYLLKMMVEGFQDAKKMTIPIDMEYLR